MTLWVQKGIELVWLTDVILSSVVGHITFYDGVFLSTGLSDLEERKPLGSSPKVRPTRKDVEVGTPQTPRSN